MTVTEVLERPDDRGSKSAEDLGLGGRVAHFRASIPWDEVAHLSNGPTLSVGTDTSL